MMLGLTHIPNLETAAFQKVTLPLRYSEDSSGLQSSQFHILAVLITVDVSSLDTPLIHVIINKIQRRMVLRVRT